MFNLNTALEALNGHDEFVVKRYDDLVVLDYIVVFPGSFHALEDEIRYRAYILWERAGGPCHQTDKFWHQAEKDCQKFAWMRRNFRGVTFSEKTGELISLPLHKFFNVNQTAETHFDLHKHRKATIYEKLDGSMIHFFKHPDGRLLASTCRSAQTPQAQEALALAKSNLFVQNLIEDEIAKGFTPIFEFVAAHNQIVVQYPAPRLVYLVSRSRTDGEYKFDDRFPDRANSFQFAFADIFSHLDKTEFEGYVCHLDNSDGSPIFMKAKTPWYLERHRAVDALMRPAYKLYQIVYDGVMDDLISLAVETYKPALMKIYQEAQSDLLQYKLRVEKEFDDVMSKEFSGAVAKIESSMQNPFAQLEERVASLKADGKKLDAIKEIRAATDLSMAQAKDYYDLGKWPDGFVQTGLDDKQKQAIFADLVKKEYPEDFELIMKLYSGSDPTKAIQDRLMEVYRVKYPEKLFANLDIVDS